MLLLLPFISCSNRIDYVANATLSMLHTLTLQRITGMSRTVLYARTSSAEQTIKHQTEQAIKAGFTLDDVIEDEGISGVQVLLADRDNGKRLFDILREGDVLLVRWVDRLGRNYDDIQKNIRLFLDRGVTIKTIINSMTFEAKPKDAMSKAIRDAMLSFMSAMAEAQTIAMKEAQSAGIAHAKSQGSEGRDKYRGRKPSYTFEDYCNVLALRMVGFGVNETARRTDLNKFVVSRISLHQYETYGALEKWRLLPDVGPHRDMPAARAAQFKHAEHSASVATIDGKMGGINFGKGLSKRERERNLKAPFEIENNVKHALSIKGANYSGMLGRCEIQHVTK
jgi:putative DNA-invertase from lambdoid prophage Rac